MCGPDRKGPKFVVSIADGVGTIVVARQRANSGRQTGRRATGARCSLLMARYHHRRHRFQCFNEAGRQEGRKPKSVLFIAEQ